MLYCSHCGTQNRDGSKFCNHCGARLTPPSGLVCPMCSTPNPLENAFCFKCNARLVPMTAPPAEEKPSSAPPIKGLSLPTKIEPAEASVAPEKADAPAIVPPQESSAPPKTDEPEWLSRLRATTPPLEEDASVDSAGDVPGWLDPTDAMPVPSASALTSEPEAKPVEPELIMPVPSSTTEEPTWLANLRGENSAPATPATDPAESSNAEEPSWVSQLRTSAQQNSDKSDSDTGVPDWLQSAESTQSQAATETPAAPAASTVTDEPDWLKPAVVDELSEMAQADEGVPDWLRSTILPSVPVTATPERRQAADTSEMVLQGTTEEEETSDEEWLRRIQSGEGIQVPMSSTSVRVSNQPFAEEEIPDWLRFAVPSAQPESIPGATPAQPIEPAQVPEWIAALKPAGETEGDQGEGEPIEASGPLAGLRGVLPFASAIAEPHILSQAAAPAPRRSGANLFESILATSTASAAAPVAKKKRAWPIMRWLIYLTLLFAILVPLILPPDLSSELMPISRTPAREFFEVLDKATPLNATIVVAFEYEPGLAGEMDLQARALLRYLAGKRVKVATLSTFETGSQQAQRVINSVVETGKYEYGSQIIDLGYFPGNEVALANLVTSKFTPTRLDARDKKPIRPFLETARITQLSDATMVIVLAGNEDTLKMWMEQVQPRGVKLSAGVSAAVEPRARAYRDAKQLLAMMAGLTGAAQFEILSGKSGAAVLSASAQNMAIVVLIIVVMVGNLALLLNRAQPRSEKK